MSDILLPCAAPCRLIAEAELNYQKVDTSDSTQHVSTHALTHGYSLLYDASGRFVNGRFGKYNVSLGYELMAFDSGASSSTAPHESFSGSKGHFVYAGEMVIDPKEVPFRLTLHSQDMSRERFYSNTTLNNSALTGEPLSVISGIASGSHVDSGVTLVMGVKNGMTNGYNEVLRHFPMLMLDYSDVINKETNGSIAVDNRLTRLAFVSLNKKDNWFHYRFFTYTDNIDQTNNYDESQFQLGTVDQLLQRRWVDFANWLTLSVDGQFTKRVNARIEQDHEEFSLNFFGIARRQSWELRTFNNFSRLNENNIDRITYVTSLPVYVNGIISPTANWSAFTKYNDSHTDKGVYFTSAAGGYTIDSFRKSLFTLNQSSSVERVTTSESDETLIIGANASTASTAQFSRDLSLLGTYNIQNFRNSKNGGGESFTNQEISGRAAYSLKHNLRIAVGQSNTFTAGAAQSISGNLPGSTITSEQYRSPYGDTNSGSSYQSRSSLDVSWAPKPRISLALSVSEDIFAASGGFRTNLSTVSSTVGYNGDTISISSQTSYNTGAGNNSDSFRNLATSNSVSYAISRNLDTKVTVNYFNSLGKDNATLGADQVLNYSYYHVNGITRKLFEINESFVYNESSTFVLAPADYNNTAQAFVTSKLRTNEFRLGARYYPLRQIMIAGGARYFFNNNYENEVVTLYGSLAFQFRLLDASLDYTYANSKADNRIEKRLLANVKKRF